MSRLYSLISLPPGAPVKSLAVLIVNLDMNHFLCRIGLFFIWTLSIVQAENLPVGRVLLLAFHGAEAPLDRLAEFEPAGFLFYPSNIPSTDTSRSTTQSLQEAASYPLLFGIDQEGGPFNAYRVDNATLFPGNMALAATGQAQLAKQVAEAIGQELRYAGFNLLFAPVVDVNSNMDNPIIGIRSFGAEVATVQDFGLAFLDGLQHAGIAAVAKHFPGHGDTSVDSHLALPRVEADLERLRRVELAPFAAQIAAGVPALMSAHVVFAALDDSVPATLSEPVLTGLLRQELGFTGLVVTDFMDMRAITDHFGAGEAAVRALLAGADLLLLGPDIERQREVKTALQHALASGRLPEARLQDAISRIEAVATSYRPDWEAGIPDYSAHQALADQVASAAATLLSNDGILPLPSTASVLVLAPRPTQFGEPPLLGELLAERHARVQSFQLSLNPDSSEIALALERAITADIVVLGSYRWLGDFPQGMADLQAALAGLDIPLVVVALGNPDDLRFFLAMPDAYLAVYGFHRANLRAAAALLTGELPRGKLPVPVGTIPLGFGMEGF